MPIVVRHQVHGAVAKLRGELDEIADEDDPLPLEPKLDGPVAWTALGDARRSVGT
ncbi:hypothetical protein [Curtobacterium sp. SORGH_AS_0776]|jgi:hypothetical protein|uniref:hypothetical protein n=1 Tax=Curtobacterium sp. SORGH_AS_0776 TaxID=3041798 RepID=UPI0028607FF0|nr:hypothetical protein [Curtobacterium sp. SORGH_AS_0776]MDR6170448.1 hypothetical protein [Curtobacterium sp. SORGH_AS_0776]